MEVCFPDERIDDLSFGHLRLIQSQSAFSLCTDDVLLAAFAKLKPGMRICDIGTGTGILPMLLSLKNADIWGDAVEIQAECAARTSRNFILNGLDDRFAVHHEDIRNYKSFLRHQSYDLIICNPPYSDNASSLAHSVTSLHIARHEVHLSLDDLFKASKFLLKYHGHLVFMLPAPRLSEAIVQMRTYKLEPKHLRMIHAYSNKPARLFLMDAQYGTGSGLIVDPPLITNNPDGTLTEEAIKCYKELKYHSDDE